MTDVLDLMKPGTAEIIAYGARVEVESLKFLDWFRFDTFLAKCLSAFAAGEIARCLGLIGSALEVAAGLSPSETSTDEALAAFVVLVKLNELRYMDPDFVVVSEEGRRTDEGPENSVLVELVTTLAIRFSMSEIEDMTPELAILLWQNIREEISMDRDVIFYSTEMGYDKKWTDKKKGKYTLVPRKSPYTPMWQRRKTERLEKLERAETYVPRFVTDAGGVVDAKTGKTLKELGEVEDET